MSIKISYAGNNQKLIVATKIANELLASQEFFTMIESRISPYEESVPADLSPKKIADFFRTTELRLTLQEYKAKKSIGGKFMPAFPDKIWGNIKTWTEGCTFAAILIHECTHALSYHLSDVDFSHGKNNPSNSQETAPYAIQRELRLRFCNENVDKKMELVPVELN